MSLRHFVPFLQDLKVHAVLCDRIRGRALRLLPAGGGCGGRGGGAWCGRAHAGGRRGRPPSSRGSREPGRRARRGPEVNPRGQRAARALPAAPLGRLGGGSRGPMRPGPGAGGCSRKVALRPRTPRWSAGPPEPSPGEEGRTTGAAGSKPRRPGTGAARGRGPRAEATPPCRSPSAAGSGC